MSYPFLNKFLQSGQLVRSSGKEYQVREQRSLDRLQRLPSRTYLQEYDLLFRYVSLWLVEQGYELTNKQPHQVLAQVCEQFASREQVKEIVRCRHEFKYYETPPSEFAMASLQVLVDHLKAARMKSYS
jgi:hypothetical protein